MKKGWIIKYVVALALGVIIAVFSADYLRNADGSIKWYVYLIPVVALSMLSVWQVVKRYVTLALDRLDVGDRAYTLLFRALLIICGVLLLAPLLVVGAVLTVLHFIKELTLAKERRRARKVERDRSEGKSPENTGDYGESEEIRAEREEGTPTEFCEKAQGGENEREFD